MDASGGGYEEIIRRLDELKAGQAGLERRLDALQAGLEGRLDKLQAGLERLEDGLIDLRASTTDNHQLLVATTEALNIASLRSRVDVTELQRKLG
jgi:hypothetical protein